MHFKSFKTTGKPIGCLLLFLIVQTLTGQRAYAQNILSDQPQEILAQATGATTVQSPQAICPAQLGDAIEAVTNRPEFARSRWGILIQPLSTSDTLYARDRSTYFTPASNVKLFTTAAALQKLGSAYRIRTSVYSTSTDPNIQSVRLVGRGDPSLTATQLTDLAQQLKRQGYDRIQQLVVDNGYFQGNPLHPSWEWEDVHYYYGTPVNSLILNQNALELSLSPQAPGRPLQVNWRDPFATTQWQVQNDTVTSEAGSSASVEVTPTLAKPTLHITGQLPVGSPANTRSLAVPDPANYFLQHFRFALLSQQIPIAQTGIVSRRDTATNERELAAVESPPLTTLIADTNQPSNNLYAEALLRTLGATQPEQNQKTAETGLAVLKQTLTELGVDPESYKIVDGSGLSRHNLVTPDAIVQLLKAMAQSREAEVFRASLPVAGVSGTLRNRFRDTPAQGIVQAKTGTMTGATSLSGYINAPNYQPVVFSIFANQSNQPTATIRQAVDEIVLLLTRLRRC